MNVTDVHNELVLAIMRLTLAGTITPAEAVRALKEAKYIKEARLQVVALSVADVFAASGL